MKLKFSVEMSIEMLSMPGIRHVSLSCGLHTPHCLRQCDEASDWEMLLLNGSIPLGPQVAVR